MRSTAIAVGAAVVNHGLHRTLATLVRPLTSLVAFATGGGRQACEPEGSMDASAAPVYRRRFLTRQRTAS